MKTPTPMIPHCVTSSSNYAFVSLFILNVHPLAAKMTHCTFKLTIKLLQTFILWCMPGSSNHLFSLNRCKLTFRRASHISESKQLLMDWTNSCPTFSLTQMITIRKICCYFSSIMLLNTIVLNYFSISRATLDYICQALKAWAKIASVSSWLKNLMHILFISTCESGPEWNGQIRLHSSKNRSASHIRGKNSAMWM